MIKIILICLFNFLTLSQPIQNSYIDALINNKSSITDFVDTNELARSERLEIKYTDVNIKWLISFDIPDEIKAGFREGKYNYSLQTMQLEDGFSVVTLAVGSLNYLQKFYFLNGKFVPPTIYFTRNWVAKESRYFKFRISEPKYFNDYSYKRLDDFVDSLCTLLEIEPARKRLLETEKIYYTFCRDEDEVEKITGYKSKGMSVLAFDEVITAYQTHFHEVSHILINFKLKNLGLYTLPFFMEGFSVAVGGRGGMAPRVVTDLGFYLQKSGFLTYDSILTYESFYSQDANMTYAVSGLYNRFLLEEFGAKKYLELYTKVNGDFEFVKNIKSESLILPDTKTYIEFLTKCETEKDIILNKADTYDFNIIINKISYEESENFLYFLVEDKYSPIKDSGSIINKEYCSKMFEELTGKEYDGEKYLICADSNSIKVYNCYNNLLIASYDRYFSLDKRKVTTALRKRSELYPFQTVITNRLHVFYLKKSLFDSEFRFINAYKIND